MIRRETDGKQIKSKIDRQKRKKMYYKKKVLIRGTFVRFIDMPTYDDDLGINFI